MRIHGCFRLFAFNHVVVFEQLRAGRLTHNIWLKISTMRERVAMNALYMHIDKGQKAAKLIVSMGNIPTPQTSIQYRLAEESLIRLSVFNILGQQVRVLDKGLRPAGTHRVAWDGRDESGQTVASGIYLYILKAGLHTEIRTTPPRKRMPNGTAPQQAPGNSFT
ncbi:MAG: FlgD immunoglobulin-like domain containing protein [Candidatus Latescibacterota bacterium]